MAALYDLDLIWRGNNRPIIWRFKDVNGDLLNLSGTSFRLYIRLPSASDQTFVLVKDSATSSDFLVDALDGTLTWNISLADSRLVPRGRLASYELEWVIGPEQRTLIAGYAIGQGGGNLDA